MATTLKSATLKVTIEEEIILNGVRQDSKNVLRISDVNEISKRIVNIGTAEIGLLGFGTAYNTELSKTYLAGLHILLALLSQSLLLSNLLPPHREAENVYQV